MFRCLCFQPTRFDSKVESTLCRACGLEAETTEHLVLKCESLLPPAIDQQRLHPKKTLADALGFTTTTTTTPLMPGTGGVDVNDLNRARENCNMDSAAAPTPPIPDSWSHGQCVQRTKRRLEHWWHKIHKSGS